MLICGVGTRRPVCIDRESTVEAAGKLMRAEQVATLVVTEPCRGSVAPAGILSAREIVTRVLAHGLDAHVLTVGDLLWSCPTPASLTDSVPETVRRLCEAGDDALPVVDESGRLAGVVALEDLLEGLHYP
jgi:CBS domain-containing protein